MTFQLSPTVSDLKLDINNTHMNPRELIQLYAQKASFPRGKSHIHDLTHHACVTRVYQVMDLLSHAAQAVTVEEFVEKIFAVIEISELAFRTCTDN